MRGTEAIGGVRSDAFAAPAVGRLQHLLDLRLALFIVAAGPTIVKKSGVRAASR